MGSLVLEFSEKVVRALELNLNGEIVLKDEMDLNFNLYGGIQKNSIDEIEEEFSQNISRLLNKDFNDEISAGILINTGMTFLNVFPVDFNEEQRAIDSHILWELSNYFPDTYKNYNIKYYRLNNNAFNRDTDEILLIAVNKTDVETVRELCESSNLKILNLEIDHFAVEKCIPDEYKKENKKILIAGCNSSRIDFSFLENGKLRYYDFRLINGKNKNKLAEMLKFFIAAYKDIDCIFIYGEDSAAAEKFLKDEFHWLMTRPLIYDESKDTCFAPLLGLALKNISK